MLLVRVEKREAEVCKCAIFRFIISEERCILLGVIMGFSSDLCGEIYYIYIMYIRIYYIYICIFALLSLHPSNYCL